jgi:hypothetical protein
MTGFGHGTGEFQCPPHRPELTGVTDIGEVREPPFHKMQRGGTPDRVVINRDGRNAQAAELLIQVHGGHSAFFDHSANFRRGASRNNAVSCPIP